MTRYTGFAVDFTDGEHLEDDYFDSTGHPATIEITDLWVIIRSDITITWTPRERVHAVSVRHDTAVSDDAAAGHDGKHVDQPGDNPA